MGPGLLALGLALSLGLLSWAHASEARAEGEPKVSYRLEIAPLLSRAGCNQGACHGNASGKGGFRLSLRGDDPDFDFQALTREALGRRVSPAAPEQSLVLLKATGRIAHEGGVRFAADSDPAQALRGWIAAGARDDRVTAPRLRSIAVTPAQAIVDAPARSQQLQVRATFSDGSTRDVTRQATFEVGDPTTGEVSPAGQAIARGPGEITIAVRFLTGRGVSRITFLPHRPGFAWSAPPERNQVDALVFERLRTLRVNPSPAASDSTFLRRATLDAVGRLPTPEETRTFLAQADPLKRDRWIDSLLVRHEFADFWALKWADLLRNEEKTMGAKGVWVFQRWLRDQIAQDAPLDAMVRAIVASRGSTWTNPPTSFYRTNRDPTAAAETFAQVFLGIRLQCARCHNHPFDDWTQDDYYGLAACFSNVRRKEVNNLRRDNLDRHEINGDEVVYVSGPAGMTQPRTRRGLAPRPPGAGALAAGPGQPAAIEQLADWLTRDNRQFARNLANRVWFHLMGRGLVEPVDDFRASNPPSNPRLMEALTDHLIASGMRLRPLVGLIMKSQTYQLSAAPNATNAGDVSGFARAAVRPLPAEVLLDAISQVLDVPDRFRSAPREARAVELPGAAGDNPFLRSFGKPQRLLTCECERTETTTLAQAFQMINGESVRRKLEAPRNRIARRLEAGVGPEPLLDELYLAALCRPPSEPERRAVLEHLRKTPSARAAWQDVAWAILNSKEFLLRH